MNSIAKLPTIDDNHNQKVKVTEKLPTLEEPNGDQNEEPRDQLIEDSELRPVKDEKVFDDEEDDSEDEDYVPQKQKRTARRVKDTKTGERVVDNTYRRSRSCGKKASGKGWSYSQSGDRRRRATKSKPNKGSSGGVRRQRRKSTKKTRAQY